MPLPTRTVAATFTGRAGATVLFRLLNTVSDGTDIAEAGTQTLATLDGSGVLSQALLCQDPSLDADPVYDWRPIFGFAEWVRGIVVPAGTGSVALASLSPSGTPLTPTQFTQLDEAVTAEATARAAGDTANASNLTAETTRATTAEAGKAATVHTHGEADVTGLTTDLAGKAATAHAHTEADVTGLSTDLAAKVPTTRLVAGHALSADVTLVKGDVGLGNVDNTTDASKPVSTAQAAADTAVQIAAAADATSKVATETSRATTAEALKAPLASPALTGTPTAPTKAPATNSTALATTAYADAAVAAQHTTDNGAYAALQPGYAPARTTPPQQRRTARRMLTNDPGADGWTLVTADASSTVSDTTNALYGTQCATLVTKGDGTQSSLRKLALTAMDFSQWDLEILLKVDDITHLSQSGSVPLLVYLGNTSLAANFQQVLYRVVDGNSFLSGEWYRLRITCPTTATSGSPTRTAITDLQLSAWDDNTGNKVTVHVQQVALVPKSSVFPSGVATVCFDDSWSSQWTNGLPRLAAYGYPATVHPILDNIDTATHLSLTQCKQLRDLHGWEIGAHAATTAGHSAGFDTLSAAALDAELSACKAWMRQNGFISESFAYPLGRFTVATADAVRHYFSASRTTTFTPAETVPPEDFTRLRGLVVNSASTVASVKAAIDAAMLQGQWINLIFHEVNDTPIGGSYVSVANYNAIIDYLSARGIPVMTVQDALAAMASEPNYEGVTLDLLANGEETANRDVMNSSIALGSGTVRYQFFTARKTELATNVTTMTSTTAASGLTLAKMGLYSVDDAGNLTLLSATASDTTLFGSTGTEYSRALTTAVSKVRGKRYAIAFLVIGTTAPTLGGVNATGSGTAYNKPPLRAAIQGSQSDLPATVTAASLTGSGNKVYATTTP